MHLLAAVAVAAVQVRTGRLRPDAKAHGTSVIGRALTRYAAVACSSEEAFSFCPSSAP
jgi:hypothetical protein